MTAQVNGLSQAAFIVRPVSLSPWLGGFLPPPCYRNAPSRFVCKGVQDGISAGFQGHRPPVRLRATLPPEKGPQPRQKAGQARAVASRLKHRGMRFLSLLVCPPN